MTELSMIDKLKSLYRHISDLDSGSDDANTLLWAINEIGNTRPAAVDDGRIYDKIEAVICLSSVRTSAYLTPKIIEAIRPYLRTPDKAATIAKMAGIIRKQIDEIAGVVLSIHDARMVSQAAYEAEHEFPKPPTA